jgi:DNA-binding response OmpR family regulator
LAWLDGNPVTLSRREIDLLTELASADGRWISPEALVEKLFGLATESGTNTLNVHIHNVRRKLGSEAISTARGMGYRLGWALDSDPR